MWTRRECGKAAVAGAAGSGCTWGVTGGPYSSIVSAAERPNSMINGVQIGTITYSYRSMPDQSAEATLRYIVDSGISEIELMSGAAESFAGAPSGGRGGGGGGGRGASLTPEQQAAQQAVQREARENTRKWR